MTGILIETYETKPDEDYVLPVHLQGVLSGYYYKVLDDDTGIFRSRTGISGYVRAKNITKETGSHGLILEVQSDKPRPKNQQDAVTRLLRKLPMFNPEPIKPVKSR